MELEIGKYYRLVYYEKDPGNTWFVRVEKLNQFVNGPHMMLDGMSLNYNKDSILGNYDYEKSITASREMTEEEITWFEMCIETKEVVEKPKYVETYQIY